MAALSCQFHSINHLNSQKVKSRSKLSIIYCSAHPIQSNIKVVINGAAKEIGRAAVLAVTNARGMEVAGAVDTHHVGEDVGQELKDDFHIYLKLGKWPDGESQDKRSILLSWFLQWYNVPASSVIRTAIDRVKPKRMSSSSIPLLRLSLPRTHINVISEIERCLT